MERSYSAAVADMTSVSGLKASRLVSEDGVHVLRGAGGPTRFGARLPGQGVPADGVAPDARRRAWVHRRPVVPGRRAGLDRVARAGGVRRPGSGPGRSRRGDGGDGAGALRGAVLLVGRAGDAGGT